jgi:hypothetical protein
VKMKAWLYMVYTEASTGSIEPCTVPLGPGGVHRVLCDLLHASPAELYPFTLIHPRAFACAGSSSREAPSHAPDKHLLSPQKSCFPGEAHLGPSV